MSLFRKSDYKEKNQKNVMKKTKLPTQDKTKKHKCSQCIRMDAGLVTISENEKLWLCPVHIEKFKAQFKEETKVNFVKAGRLI